MTECRKEKKLFLNDIVDNEEGRNAPFLFVQLNYFNVSCTSVV